MKILDSSQNTADFENTFNELLKKLIAFYSEHFEIRYNVDIGEITVPVIAKMSNRQEKALFGFGLKKPGKEALEYVAFLSEPVFDENAMARAGALIAQLEKEYVHPDSDHAFTFLSAVIITEKAEKQALGALKKFRLRRDYGKEGWILSRIAVFEPGGESFSNKDGVDLKNLIRRVIAQ